MSRREQSALLDGLGQSVAPSYKGRSNVRAEVVAKRDQEARERVRARQSGKEFEVYDNDQLEPIPSYPKRECIFVTGPQGCGKSYWSGRYARAWKEQHPDGEVLVFSQIDKDDALDRVGITRVLIDDGLISNPYKISELKNKLIIFDDIDLIRDMKLRKAVRQLCDDCLEIGRKEDIWVIRTSHQCRNWAQTRSPLLESDKVVFFLQKGAPRPIRGYLRDYMALGDNTIDLIVGNDKKKIRPLPSRWVMLSTHVPHWIMGQQVARIL